MYDPRAEDPSVVTKDDPNSLAELLQELRILLQGAQVFAGFLVVLPFSERFAQISAAEKWTYLAAFLAILTSLILFSAPALHHRLQRPLTNRIQFKNFATRMMVLGAIPLSLGLMLATQVAVSEINGELFGTLVALVMACFIAFAWWISPKVFPNRPPSANVMALTQDRARSRSRRVAASRLRRCSRASTRSSSGQRRPAPA